MAETEPILPVSDAAIEDGAIPVWHWCDAAVAIGIGSSEPYKQWGAERFAALGRRPVLRAGSVNWSWSAAELRLRSGRGDPISGRLGRHHHGDRLEPV